MSTFHIDFKSRPNKQFAVSQLIYDRIIICLNICIYETSIEYSSLPFTITLDACIYFHEGYCDLNSV